MDEANKWRQLREIQVVYTVNADELQSVLRKKQQRCEEVSMQSAEECN